MASVMATFSLDVKAWSALAELARKTGLSKSEIVRALIHQEWERQDAATQPGTLMNVLGETDLTLPFPKGKGEENPCVAETD